MLLKKTPLWYYILREAAVLHQGEQLGPVEAGLWRRRLLRILKRDATSFLNVSEKLYALIAFGDRRRIHLRGSYELLGVTKP